MGAKKMTDESVAKALGRIRHGEFAEWRELERMRDRARRLRPFLKEQPR